MEILSRLVSKQVFNLLFLSTLCTPHSAYFGFNLEVLVFPKGVGILILVLIKLHPFVCLFFEHQFAFERFHNKGNGFYTGMAMTM